MDNISDFSKWIKWEERNEVIKSKRPGVYALAKSKKSLVNKEFSLINDIVYFGMSNSKGGVKSRLNAFHRTCLKKKSGHGGAARFAKYYLDKEKEINIFKNLYVAVKLYDIKLTTNTNDPVQLRIKGEIAREEYLCLARFVEFSKTNSLPLFNDYDNKKIAYL